MKYYMLKGRKVVGTNDLMEWAEWFENANQERRVGYSEFKNGAYVSTVFLGLDHSFGGDKPLFFETMAFNTGIEELDGATFRYETWDEAYEGHNKIVEEIKNRLNK